MKQFVVAILFVLSALFTHGQNANPDLEDGVSLYRSGNYIAASVALNLWEPENYNEEEQQSYWLGRTFISLNKYGVAVSYLREIDSLYGLLNVPLHLGVAYYHLDSLPQAINQLQMSLVLDSSNDTAYYFLGLAQYHMGLYPDAYLNFQTAFAIAPNRKGVSKYLGISEYHYDLFFDAIVSLQRALVLDKYDPEIYNYLGMSHYRLGRIDKAIATLKSGVELEEKESAESAVNLALLYNDIEENDSALIYLQKALDLDSNDIDALFITGNVYYDMGEYAQSKEYFERLLKINPKYRAAYKQLANVYFFENKFDEAIEKYRITTFYEENNAEILNYIGISYLQKEEYEQAEQYFEEAILIDPEYGLAYYNLAWIAFNREEYNDAISYLTYAKKQLGDDSDVYFLFGKVYLQLGILSEAEHYFAESIRFNPLKENNYLYMGHLSLLKNEKQRAAFYYDILLVMDPENTEARYHRALIDFFFEDFPSAIEHMQIACSLEPENDKFLMALAKAQLKDRRSQQALESLQLLSKRTPEDARVYYMMSVVFRQLKERSMANYYETLAVRMDPLMAGFIF